MKKILGAAFVAAASLTMIGVDAAPASAEYYRPYPPPPPPYGVPPPPGFRPGFPPPPPFLRPGFHRPYPYPPVYSRRDYDDDDDCYVYKRRAQRTGSRYWWHKYRECRDG